MHLWTHDPTSPPEYTELILCRNVYHCLPSALKREPVLNILPHLTCLRLEGLYGSDTTEMPE